MYGKGPHFFDTSMYLRFGTEAKNTRRGHEDRDGRRMELNFWVLCSKEFWKVVTERGASEFVTVQGSQLYVLVLGILEKSRKIGA